jgi:hypothetical protein
MDRMNAIYVFKENLDAFVEWRKKYPCLLGVWWDGESSMIDGLMDLFKPNTIIVEEKLLNNLEQRATITPLPKTIPQPSFPLNSSKNPSESELPICIFPSNDTHVYLFKPIIDLIENYKICISKLKTEGAKEALNNEGIPFSYLQHHALEANQYSVLISANDWGPVELQTHKIFQKFRTPTVCLQESVIDFGDRFARMEWCHFPFIQGIVTAKHLQHEIMFLTGNPRYETLSPSSFPSNQRVLINSNFTYGIYEEIRESWIEDIVQTCTELGLDYLISQHPRDLGNLSSYNVIRSHAGVVHEMLRESSVLITRFSSLIHESIALGRPVIFFNPHNEAMNYDFNPDGIHIYVTRSREQLRKALKTIILDGLEDPLHDPFYMTYGMHHHGAADGEASRRVVEALRTIQKSCYLPKSRSINGLLLRIRLARWRFRQFKKGLGSNQMELI